jgi:hypothetical protein
VNRSRPIPPRNRPILLPGRQTRTGGRGERATVVFNFPQINSRHLILKEVDCQGRSAKAVIDTGSGISQISPAFCRTLGIEQFGEWEGPRLLLANGDPLVPEGSVMWKLCGRAVDLGNGGGEWDERI